MISLLALLTFQWGSTPEKSFLSLDQEGGCDVLSIHNGLSMTEKPLENVFLGGHQIIFIMGGGRNPDTFYVVPKDGWYAEPESITLEDPEVGTIYICPMIGA